jgi:hypothetical protein
METTVWAPRSIPELHGAVGFVVCDVDLAEQLIAEGLVQDPRVGMFHMEPILHAPTKHAEVEARDVVAKKRSRRAVDADA